MFLQDAELEVREGTNVSVCGEIELAGQLLTDIEILFVTIGGGPGAGQCKINISEKIRINCPSG